MDNFVYNDISIPKGIAVYCGSSSGNNPRFATCAREIGREMARASLPLIYGGGHMGLMGEVGSAVREHGGVCVAVIPGFMVERGWNDASATHTIVTESMHRRKEIMARAARGIIALPGGIGTFEELSEIITWRQLGLFSGAVVIMNIDGYYDNWLAQIDKAVECGFFRADHRRLFIVTDNPAEAVRLASDKDNIYNPSPKF